MPEINSQALKFHREQRHLTLDGLAELSKVDRSTINKIETGKRTKSRPSTLGKIAAALGVEVSELTGVAVGATNASPIASEKNQMNFRMANDVRNALNLTAMRYGVKASHILHLAPLLFRWAAETSLKWRGERLDEIETRLDALSHIATPKHLNDDVTHNWRADEPLNEERRSIAKRDLFGMLLPDDALPFDYEESEQNPMSQFLKSVAASLGDDVEFEHWSPRWSHPGYTLGKSEALGLVGGNEDAAQHIVDGYAPLHELPKEIREQGTEAVAQWAIETGQQYLNELIDLDSLILDMGGSDE
jgi:transcriptional regulator with XRE-family HTH domain